MMREPSSDFSAVGQATSHASAALPGVRRNRARWLGPALAAALGGVAVVAGVGRVRGVSGVRTTREPGSLALPVREDGKAVDTRDATSATPGSVERPIGEDSLALASGETIEFADADGDTPVLEEVTKLEDVQVDGVPREVEVCEFISNEVVGVAPLEGCRVPRDDDFKVDATAVAEDSAQQRAAAEAAAHGVKPEQVEVEGATSVVPILPTAERRHSDGEAANDSDMPQLADSAVRPRVGGTLGRHASTAYDSFRKRGRRPRDWVKRTASKILSGPMRRRKAGAAHLGYVNEAVEQMPGDNGSLDSLIAEKGGEAAPKDATVESEPAAQEAQGAAEKATVASEPAAQAAQGAAKDATVASAAVAQEAAAAVQDTTVESKAAAPVDAKTPSNIGSASGTVDDAANTQPLRELNDELRWLTGLAQRAMTHDQSSPVVAMPQQVIDRLQTALDEASDLITADPHGAVATGLAHQRAVAKELFEHLQGVVPNSRRHTL